MNLVAPIHPTCKITLSVIYALVGVSRLVCREFHFPKSKGAPTTALEHLLKLFVGAPCQPKVETIFCLTGNNKGVKMSFTFSLIPVLILLCNHIF